ncbi:MAG: MarC family protein [Opitutaceae bacterium]
MTLFSAAATLLLILDPFGNIALFNSILGRIPPERRRRVLVREVIFAYVLLILFLLVGGRLLGFLGLQQSSLSIAGGIMLFMIAIGMVFPKSGVTFGAESGDEEPFIVPLATPLIAGPSGMAFLLLLASQHPGRLGEWTLAVTAASAVTAAILILGDRLLILLGNRGMRAIERLMGMILTLVAVQMILNGLSLYVANLRAPV